MEKQTWLITGASSGLGLDLAQYVLEQGDQVVLAAATSDTPPRWLVLGSDAFRRIGVKLDALHTEYDLGKDVALSTDYPDAGPPVL